MRTPCLDEFVRLIVENDGNWVLGRFAHEHYLTLLASDYKRLLRPHDVPTIISCRR